MYNGNEEVERLWESRGPLSILQKPQSCQGGLHRGDGQGDYVWGGWGEKWVFQANGQTWSHRPLRGPLKIDPGGAGVKEERIYVFLGSSQS